MVETADTTTGFGIVLSLAIAVFGAMRGATGIVLGLNIVYDVEESRTVVWRTLTRLAITICAILLILGGEPCGLARQRPPRLLPNLGGILRQALQIGFWVATAVAVSLVIYTYAPNRSGKQVRWLTPRLDHRNGRLGNRDLRLLILREELRQLQRDIWSAGSGDRFSALALPVGLHPAALR